MIATVKPPIEEIVRAIVNSVHPRRVVLFGSYARGDARPDSDVDLMVEMDVELDPREREAEIRDLWQDSAWHVDPKVYDSALVDRMCDQPGHLLYVIVREGRVVYARADAAGAATQQRLVREQPQPPRFIDLWLEKADDDLGVVAELQTSQRIRWGPVCFHAQQGAEKYLKALLIQRGQHPDRTHDLSRLLRACRGAGYVLNGLDDDCRLLSRFAVDARYPGDVKLRPTPTPLEGKAAVAACDRIVAAARNQLIAADS